MFEGFVGDGSPDRSAAGDVSPTESRARLNISLGDGRQNSDAKQDKQERHRRRDEKTF
jgi:hypothetical protein